MRRAAYYVTYLPRPDLHSNTANYNAGIGRTPEESREAAEYWNNQWPWVITVPASRVPNWALEEAELACAYAGRRPCTHDTLCNCTAICQTAEARGAP